MKIVVIQGPNLNMLGIREKNIYGKMRLEDIHRQMKYYAENHSDKINSDKINIEFFQNNSEGKIIDKIHECFEYEVDGIIINPAGYTHTSIAIRDAILSINIPSIEVHISNTHQREPFREKSLITPVSAGLIVGFGPFGYHLALIAIIQIVNDIKNKDK